MRKYLKMNIAQHTTAHINNCWFIRFYGGCSPL